MWIGKQTTFAYDADGQRVLTTHTPGDMETKVYTPFPDYEMEDPPGAGGETFRVTYRLAGQMVAVRAAGVLYYTYTDHLGNVVLLTWTGGTILPGSAARYDPFGNYRTWPGSNVNPAILDRGFTGHAHNNTGPYPTYNLGLIYMNARYYHPQLGRFVSPDTIVPEPANPQAFNRYAYSYNNPINYTDPDGHCPAPASGTGQVICIDLFISSEFVDPFGFGYGDNRGFDTDSDPSQSRAYVYIYLDKDGAFQRQAAFFNTSCTQIGCFGPVPEFDTFSIIPQDNGDLLVTWDLLNGVSGEFRSTSDELHALGLGNASNVAYLASLPLAAINGELMLSLIDGQYQIVSLNRDPFPSLEAYAYQDGQYAYTLAQLAEHGWGAFVGLNPLAPNERYNSPVWYSDNATNLLGGSTLK